MREAHRLAVHLQRARVGRIEPEHQPRELGAARAEQSGHADDLAVVEVEAHRMETAPRAEAAQRHAWRSAFVGCVLDGHLGVDGLGRRQRHVASHHRRHQRGRGQLRGRPFAHEAAVAQHGDAVRDRVDLVEEVRDEQDRQTRLAQAAQHREQALDFAVVQAGRRLVEDQHLGIDAQRAGDGHQLLHGHRQRADRALRIDVEIQAGEQGARLAHHARAVDGLQSAPAAARVAARVDVLRHREVGAEVDFLVDGADAQLLRCQRAGRRDGRPVQRERSRVRCDDAGEDLDQRGLARAVLPHQRVHLSGAKLQLHAFEHGHGAEALVDSRGVQQGIAPRARMSVRRIGAPSVRFIVKWRVSICVSGARRRPGWPCRRSRS